MKRTEWPMDDARLAYRSAATEILHQWGPPTMKMERFETLVDLVADGIYQANQKLLKVVAAVLESSKDSDPVHVVETLAATLAYRRGAL